MSPPTGTGSTAERPESAAQPGSGDGRDGTGRIPLWRRLSAGTRWLLVLGVAAAVVAVIAVNPVRLLSPSAAVAPADRKVSVSFPHWSSARGFTAAMSNRRLVNEVSPWMYGLDAAGRIVPPADAAGRKRLTDSIARARDAGLRVVPTVANVINGKWSYQPISAILANPERRQRHIDDIVALVKDNGYSGIDIDYEELRAGDRAAFSAFIAELGDKMRAMRRTLAVAVFAKESDAGYDQRNRAQDYQAIGRAADQVRVMGYDFTWPTSPPGANAPIQWVSRTLSYAKANIPPAKISWGVSFGGYDWTRQPATSPTPWRGEPLGWLDAFKLARKYQAKVTYDQKTQASWFRYRDEAGAEHEVWFENAASSRAKFNAAAKAGVGSVFLWMVGYEDTAVWAQLAAGFATERDGARR